MCHLIQSSYQHHEVGTILKMRHSRIKQHVPNYIVSRDLKMSRDLNRGSSSIRWVSVENRFRTTSLWGLWYVLMDLTFLMLNIDICRMAPSLLWPTFPTRYSDTNYSLCCGGVCQAFLHYWSPSCHSPQLQATLLQMTWFLQVPDLKYCLYQF